MIIGNESPLLSFVVFFVCSVKRAKKKKKRRSHSQKIHDGEIKKSKNYRIQTPDKSGWNRLFDDIGRGLYPYVIVIMTTNRSPDYINSLDPSYLRPGRVDLKFNMDESVLDSIISLNTHTKE